MPSDVPHLPSEQNPAEPVFHLYMALAAALPLDVQSGLGGKLLYAGELNSEGRNLLYAANIAGAASLAASADPTVQRQAIRDGVIDFLVTSLEEALRILKNEIRKHQPVSVGVSADPHQLAAQMLDRGVLPDLLPAVSLNQASAIDPAQAEKFLSQGSRHVLNPPPNQLAGQGKFITWSVDRQFARWLPQLDTLAQQVLPTDDTLRRRWLRLAPRYLGRIAQKEHGVLFTAHESARFRTEVERLLTDHSGDTGEPIRVTISAPEQVADK